MRRSCGIAERYQIREPLEEAGFPVRELFAGETKFFRKEVAFLAEPALQGGDWWRPRGNRLENMRAVNVEAPTTLQPCVSR